MALVSVTWTFSVDSPALQLERLIQSASSFSASHRFPHLPHLPPHFSCKRAVGYVRSSTTDYYSDGSWLSQELVIKWPSRMARNGKQDAWRVERESRWWSTPGTQGFFEKDAWTRVSCSLPAAPDRCFHFSTLFPRRCFAVSGNYHIGIFAFFFCSFLFFHSIYISILLPTKKQKRKKNTM